MKEEVCYVVNKIRVSRLFLLSSSIKCKIPVSYSNLFCKLSDAYDGEGKCEFSQRDWQRSVFASF